MSETPRTLDAETNHGGHAWAPVESFCQYCGCERGTMRAARMCGAPDVGDIDTKSADVSTLPDDHADLLARLTRYRQWLEGRTRPPYDPETAGEDRAYEQALAELDRLCPELSETKETP